MRRNKREFDGLIDAKGRVSRSHAWFAMETVRLNFAPSSRDILPLVSQFCHSSHMSYSETFKSIILFYISDIVNTFTVVRPRSCHVLMM